MEGMKHKDNMEAVEEAFTQQAQVDDQVPKPTPAEAYGPTPAEAYGPTPAEAYVRTPPVKKRQQQQLLTMYYPEVKHEPL
jgi:hypothetical protein